METIQHLVETITHVLKEHRLVTISNGRRGSTLRSCPWPDVFVVFENADVALAKDSGSWRPT